MMRGGTAGDALLAKRSPPLLISQSPSRVSPVIAASVGLKSTWEGGMGAVKSETNVSDYENLIPLCLG